MEGGMKHRIFRWSAVLAMLLAATTSGQAGEACCNAGCEPCCQAANLLPANCDNPCCSGACEASCAADNSCCDCDSCCDDGCGPLWTFRAGAIFLERSNPNGPPIVTRTAGGAPVLVPDNFNFDTGTGYDLYARRRLANGCSIELRYFEVDDISAAATVPNAGLILVGGVNVGGASGIQSTYGSLFRSAEANLVGGADRWWNPIIGFRYIGFNDDLRNGFTAGGPVLLSYNVQTENRLYGGQLGFEGILYSGDRFTVDMWAKAGVYYNDIDRTTGFFPPAGAPIFPSAANDQVASFVGDLALNASYRLTEHIALRGGYQLLWLTDVAEASNQGAAFGGSAVNTDGHPFYHGAMAGVEVTW
jgi:hypothetical protein